MKQTHYIEFIIDQNRIAERERKVKTGQILSTLVSILHKIIHANQEKGESLAVSYPEYSKKHEFLGHTIRLHGSEDTLNDVFSPKSMAKLVRENQDLMEWLIDTEYLTVSQVLSVPSEVTYAVFSRKQVKGNLESVRRRRMKRHNETYEEVCAAIPQMDRVLPTTPKVYIMSKSTKQLFPLLIEKSVASAPKVGTFTSYGLAHDHGTVPMF